MIFRSSLLNVLFEKSLEQGFSEGIFRIVHVIAEFECTQGLALENHSTSVC